MKQETNEAIEGVAVGKAIRSWRKSRGLLQKQLAYAAGMEVAQLWAVENDRNSPSLRTLSRIAAALRISPAELLAPPPRDDAVPTTAGIRSATTHFDQYGAIPILRPAEKGKGLTKRDMSRMEKAMADAAKAEAAQQADIPTTLPLTFPIVVNEGGAEQLAHFLRAYLDVGSAILRDVFILFECHGIRILTDEKLKTELAAVTFYSRMRRDYTVFLSTALDKFEHRKKFAFLTEIGRAFLFAAHHFEPVPNTDKNRRFARHFAATFLMPESAVRMAVYSLRVKPNDWTLELLLRHKARFGVSAESFNTRLKELALITQAKSAEFDRIIKAHYTGTDFGELEPSEPVEKQNRAGDLKAMNCTPTR